jgi:hypothetical protein
MAKSLYGVSGFSIKDFDNGEFLRRKRSKKVTCIREQDNWKPRFESPKCEVTTCARCGAPLHNAPAYLVGVVELICDGCSRPEVE